MDRIIENRTIIQGQPGFSETKEFFMGRSPGIDGAMLGKTGELPLPVAVFLENIGEGLVDEDTQALRFLYRSIVDLTGCQTAIVGYDREGWPNVTMRGNNFPHSGVTLDMSFLVNGHMAWEGWVFSEKLLLPAHSEFDLKKIKKDRQVKVNNGPCYQGMEDNPEIKEQLSKYPDLAEVLDQLSWRIDDPITQSIRETAADWEGISIYSYNPPSPAQKEVLRRYGRFSYNARINCFVPTLNQIVDEVGQLLPDVESSYIDARSRVGVN